MSFSIDSHTDERSEMIKSFLNQIKTLSSEHRILIQTHDFPDHDAVASAFALSLLFHYFDISSYLVYCGDIQRGSLKQMIHHLSIPLHMADHFEMDESDKIIIVDGCKGNSNVTDLPGDEIAVIDHHQTSHPENVSFCDIRPDYGSCATIIGTYYRELRVPVSSHAASSILLGINMDTAKLTRRVHPQDLTVYTESYDHADIHLVNSISRNNIALNDLAYFQKIISQLRIDGPLGFCYLKDGCHQNLMGILADFLLSIEEISFVLVCAKNHSHINISVRSEELQWNSAAVLHDLLQGAGYSGGHQEMAGGIITQIDQFDADEFFLRLSGLLPIE